MSGKNNRKVFILTETYKENDPETVGAFDSMQAMMRGFAKSVAEEIVGNPITGAEEEIAKALADLIPAFFDHDYPRDEEGCIRYGKTTYGYSVMDLQGVDDFGENGEAV